MVEKDIYTKNGEVNISRISNCNCRSITECEKKCDKYSSCDTVALANDLQKEYEANKKYTIVIKKDNSSKEIKIYSSLRYVLRLRKALIQDVIDELYANDSIDKYEAEDIIWASKESIKHFEIEEARVAFDIKEGWKNLKKI